MLGTIHRIIVQGPEGPRIEDAPSYRPEPPLIWFADKTRCTGHLAKTLGLDPCPKVVWHVGAWFLDEEIHDYIMEVGADEARDSVKHRPHYFPAVYLTVDEALAMAWWLTHYQVVE